MPDSSSPAQFTPRRGRPDARQVAAIEQAILTTARRMFFEEGYDAVAMESVAAAVGVSKGTLYARHCSKEALFRAVIENSVADWSRTATIHGDQLVDDIGQRLRHHAYIVAHALAKPDTQAFHHLLLSTRDRFPDLWLTIYEVGYLHVIRLITRSIEEAAIRDAIPARRPEDIARLLISSIAGWHMQERGIRTLELTEILAMADRTVDLLMAARQAW